jgi:hypothetical protein
MKNKPFFTANFTGLLLIVFVILKWCGAIDWSWWWVLAPFWIPLAAYILLWTILQFLQR